MTLICVCVYRLSTLTNNVGVPSLAYFPKETNGDGGRCINGDVIELASLQNLTEKHQGKSANNKQDQ